MLLPFVSRLVSQILYPQTRLGSPLPGRPQPISRTALIELGGSPGGIGSRAILKTPGLRLTRCLTSLSNYAATSVNGPSRPMLFCHQMSVFGGRAEAADACSI
jgi:hypothetical protein